MKPCLVPSAFEERHLVRRPRAVLQTSELLVRDHLEGVEPCRFEVLRRRREHPLDRPVVHGLVTTTKVPHAN